MSGHKEWPNAHRKPAPHAHLKYLRVQPANQLVRRSNVFSPGEAEGADEHGQQSGLWRLCPYFTCLLASELPTTSEPTSIHPPVVMHYVARQGTKVACLKQLRYE